MRSAGVLGLGAAASLTLSRGVRAEDNSHPGEALEHREQALDSVKDIFTAALIAEDLATTFYFNALTGPVIQDVNLSGPGGTATKVTSAGNFGNVAYIRAALTEEIQHANLFRSVLGIADASGDPVQTFYFPSGSFDTLSAFTGLLDALENAFIGAYLNAIQEFGTKAAQGGYNGTYTDIDGAKYTSQDLVYYAKIAASILGVESEHRTLGRVISNSNPANNRNYETTDNLNAVYSGPHSAVAALTPFLTSSTGPAASFAYAYANEATVSEKVAGTPPAE